jgi:DNA-binding MurR/RpiR family transcriptional regulator
MSIDIPMLGACTLGFLTKSKEGYLETVADRIGRHFEQLTRAEKQLAEALLENYPVSGLHSITTVAENASVSTPTVVRMVQKLGFSGFTDFQAKLRSELEEAISNPIAKRDRWAANAPDTHILNRFTDAVLNNVRASLAEIETEDFDRAAAAMSNAKTPVYIAGGRITHSLASYLFTHLQVIRSGVTLISTNRATWPHYVLNMGRGDVLVLFDIRRYESELETMAQLAAERGVRIILFTDQWVSPISKYAELVFKIYVEVPSAWDSSVVTLIVLEALTEAVQNANWGRTRERLTELEALFSSTRLFRKSFGKESARKE